MSRRLFAAVLGLVLAACSHKADIVISGGLVWTGLSTGAPHPGNVAIADGKILAVVHGPENCRRTSCNSRR